VIPNFNLDLPSCDCDAAYTEDVAFYNGF